MNPYKTVADKTLHGSIRHNNQQQQQQRQQQLEQRRKQEAERVRRSVRRLSR